MNRRRQRGAALLIMLLILILGAAAMFARNLGGRSAVTARVDDRAAALAAAKEALLGFASTYDATRPGEVGFLPCPDLNATGTTAEGEAHLTCGARYRSAIGRLPWKTLGVDPARIGTGECLWYVVSGSYKAGGANQPEMLNTDSNGQLRVLGGTGPSVIAGNVPAERPVAAIIAPGTPIAGQVRTQLAAGVAACGGNFTPAGYLDTDAASGINNATLAAANDAVDDILAADGSTGTVNDMVAFITRGEIEARLARRADLAAKLRAMTDAVARCIADYGRRNPGGASDRRLPWPAAVDLVQYRSATQFDDTAIGWLSGRVPDRVNDSNTRTGNTTANVLTGCNTTSVPQWTAENRTLWQHWKDHLFYAVAASFQPNAAAPTACGTCLKVNGAGSVAGIVMLSGTRLTALGQVRDEPPMDTDTRSAIGNYLEGRNAANHPNVAGDGDYQSGPATATFNDVLFCLDPALNVSTC